MAPNSHVINWLRSVYRRVLHRQWVDNARQAIAADAFATARRPLDRMEPLETRVMLSSTTLFSTAKATYLGAPSVTTEIKDAMVDGLTAVATKLNALSQAGEFKTDIPGLLKYDRDFLGTFDPPKAKNLG